MIRSYIIKSNDDLRQELLSMQLIMKIKQILQTGGVNVFLKPYDILITSDKSGILEFIPETQSISNIKKLTNNIPLKDFYEEYFGPQFEEAQLKFTQSMAGYSVVSYLLNVKDRHNGNILIDSQGHVIHIDFGFMFLSSPGGNINFESAPFKLTLEMINLLGGYEGELFKYFKVLIFQALLELRKHVQELTNLIKMMQFAHLPCFQDDFQTAIIQFEKRFNVGKMDMQLMTFVNEMVNEASNN